MNNYKHNGNGTTTIIVESKTHGTFNITIDTEDHPKVEGRRWYVGKSTSHKYKDVFYVKSNGKRMGAGKREPTVRLHRVITSAPKGMQIDHINGDPLDNKQSNLRLVTNAENQHNQGKRGGSSRYKGICKVKSRAKIPGPSKWEARIRVSGEKKYLGTYTTQEEAARAYDLGVVRFREVVNARQLNFPERLKEYKEHLEKSSSES